MNSKRVEEDYKISPNGKDRHASRRSPVKSDNFCPRSTTRYTSNSPFQSYSQNKGEFVVLSKSPEINTGRNNKLKKLAKKEVDLYEDKKSTPIPIPARSNSRTPPRNSGCSPFAGAKFSDPPSPKSLPRPPNHWTQIQPNDWVQTEQNHWMQTKSWGENVAEQLKQILKVQS